MCESALTPPDAVLFAEDADPVVEAAALAPIIVDGIEAVIAMLPADADPPAPLPIAIDVTSVLESPF